MNDPDVAEVDLRLLVAKFLRTSKPRKKFDIVRVTKQNYHHGFFSEATEKVRKIQTASDAKFEARSTLSMSFMTMIRNDLLEKFSHKFLKASVLKIVS